jgi:hypothetical protein
LTILDTSKFLQVSAFLLGVGKPNSSNPKEGTNGVQGSFVLTYGVHSS